MMMLHAGGQPERFTLPAICKGLSWRLLVDTAAQSPDDIYPAADGPPFPTSGSVVMDHHSFRCYIASP
jgi:glycogen operon protein